MSNIVTLNVNGCFFHEIDVAIICLNEENRILNTISNIYEYVDGIIIMDGGSLDDTIEVIKSFNDYDNKIKIFRNRFNSFCDQKNLAISKTESLWTLVIDADETLSPKLLQNLRTILRANKDKDLIVLNRFNHIDGIPEVNYQEKQLRLFKSFCRYVSIVHEELVGWRQELSIELPEEYFIYHDKSALKFEDNQDLFNILVSQFPYKHNATSRKIDYGD